MSKNVKYIMDQKEDEYFWEVTLYEMRLCRNCTHRGARTDPPNDRCGTCFDLESEATRAGNLDTRPLFERPPIPLRELKKYEII